VCPAGKTLKPAAKIRGDGGAPEAARPALQALPRTGRLQSFRGRRTAFSRGPRDAHAHRPDSALPSLFGACHEEPYAARQPRPFGSWPATKYPWYFRLAERAGRPRAQDPQRQVAPADGREPPLWSIPSAAPSSRGWKAMRRRRRCSPPPLGGPVRRRSTTLQTELSLKNRGS